MKSEPIIEIGSYVRLKKGFDDLTDVYQGVEAGATGTVIGKKTDSYGFPMIHIDWDESNPKWAGQANKWVFESHFEAIGSPGSPEERYINSIRMATDSMLSGLGYLSIIIHKRESEDGLPYYESVLYVHSMSDGVSAILDTAVVHLAAEVFDSFNLYEENIIELEEDDDE